MRWLRAYAQASSVVDFTVPVEMQYRELQRIPED
jgi:hypothetical protein